MLPDRRRRAPHAGALPLPGFSVEFGGAWFIEQPVLVSFPHEPGSLRPSRPRLLSGTDNEPSRFDQDLHLLRQLRLLKKPFRNPNTLGVSNPDNTSFHTHRNYIVITGESFRQTLPRHCAARTAGNGTRCRTWAKRGRPIPFSANRVFSGFDLRTALSFTDSKNPNRGDKSRKGGNKVQSLTYYRL